MVDNQEASNQKEPQLFPSQSHEEIDRGCEFEEYSSGKESGRKKNVFNLF